MTGGFARTGWQVFPADPRLANWLAHAVPAAHEAVADPANAHWLRCGGTWFAGVNVLANDAEGRIGGSERPEGAVFDFLARRGLGGLPLDRAQISVIYPGYPHPREGESAAAFRYRRDRDAAHVDGLLPVGPNRRRMLREPHAYVLGLPLSTATPDAAPLVVWEGSHEIMRAAFRAALAGHRPEAWPDLDLTETYHQARRRCFDICARVPVHARPGQAYLIHRLALHGVAPWADTASASGAGRMIAYFRPEMAMAGWIDAP